MAVVAVVLMASAAFMVCGMGMALIDPSAFEGVQVEGFDGLTQSQALALFAFAMLVFGAMSVTFWTLSRIMTAISREYSPFTQDNVVRLTRIAYVFLGVSAVLLVLGLVTSARLDSVVSTIIVFLVAAVGVYSMALIFRYGAALQKESDETL